MPAVGGDMASSAPSTNVSSPTSTNASTSKATTVVQAAKHAAVETVTTVASQVQKNNSADLKDIVSNVSKEVVAAKAEDASTLIEKVEAASEELAKDVVTGVESAAKDVEAHPELIAEGAVIAAVGAVGLVAPALAVGGVAVLGKMAADSAMKTLDGIATDNSSKLVKEISSDLTKDVGDAKEPLDGLASTHTEVTVEAKAVTTINGGEPTTAKADLETTGSSNIAQDGAAVVATTAAKVAPVVPSSDEKPVTTNAAQSTSNSAPGNSVNESSATLTNVEAGSLPAVASTVAVAYRQPTSPTAPTAASMAAPSVVPPPVVSLSQELTTTCKTTHLSTSNKEAYDKSADATILVGSMKDESLVDLHQKLDSISDCLQHKDLTELYQKMDAMHTTLQTIAVLLTSIAQGQARLQTQLPTNPKSQSAVEESAPGINPPLSLITPPLPPTTVETLSEMALRDNQDVNAAVGNSEVQSIPPASTGDHPSKRSGVFEGLGKLFYLRS